jgi:hypothetical protein
MREIVRQVQAARKTAELNVDDRIVLELKSVDDEVNEAVEAFADTIKSETLALELNPQHSDFKFSISTNIDGHQMTVSLKKA